MSKITYLIGIAEAELKSLKGYERADIALRLANTLLVTDGLEAAEKTVPAREELENKPAPKEEEKPEEKPAPLTDLNPAAPIAGKIQEAMAQAPAPADEPKQEVPAPAAEAPAKPEIDINSDAWKNKILAPEELEEEWTPAMKANAELVTALTRLKEFINRGVAAGVLTPEWLDSELNKVTNGFVTSFKDKRSISPKLIKTVSPYIIKKGIELANAKKASQAAA